MYEKNSINYYISDFFENGNESSFKEIFNFYSTKMHSFAVTLVKRPEIADDIIADVFYNLWKNRQRKIKNLEAYLYISVKNYSINYLKRSKTRKSIDLDSINVEIAKYEYSPELQLISKEQLEKINQAIENLPPKCKIIFKLIKDDQLKYKEVAEILNISENTVRNQMSIALSKISNAIGYHEPKRKKSSKNTIDILLILSNLPVIG